MQALEDIRRSRYRKLLNLLPEEITCKEVSSIYHPVEEYFYNREQHQLKSFHLSGRWASLKKVQPVSKQILRNGLQVIQSTMDTRSEPIKFLPHTLR